MLDNDTGVNTGTDNQAGSQPAPTTDQRPPEFITNPGGDLNKSGADVNTQEGKSDDGKRVVTAERLNELLNDSKEFKALKERMGSVDDVNRSLDAVTQALTGKGGDKELAEDLQEITKNYDVPADLLERILTAATSRAEKTLEGKLKPLQTQSAMAQWNAELGQLKAEVPEASGMTKADEEDFRALAVQEGYNKLPLNQIWRIWSYGKEDRLTAESSRGGARNFGEEGDPVLKEMDSELEALRKARR